MTDSTNAKIRIAIHKRTSVFSMSARRIFFIAAALAVCGVLACSLAGWMEKRPLPPSGGLFIPGEILIPGPHFLQADPKWGGDLLGPTEDSLASVGCAVSSAAMVLAGYGVETDPGKLNAFLQSLPGGYTPQGWLYWEKAAESAPGFVLLPHYEDVPSYFLMDSNLLRGNPVIIRLRYPSGITHFMVVCGKSGFDYLVRDPGWGGLRGVYPLRDFGGPIEALRFYRKPQSKAALEKEGDAARRHDCRAPSSNRLRAATLCVTQGLLPGVFLFRAFSRQGLAGFFF